jgi:dihydroflavonol-4-reductase
MMSTAKGTTAMATTVLITGISGFIARHTAKRFLDAGYTVRGTVRSRAKGEDVRTSLAGHCDVEKLSFVEADLLADNGWSEAVTGCDSVAHIASPFPFGQPRHENDLIRPAVDGTLRVLKAAKAAGVPRFVQTSSNVAVAYGHPPSKTRFTEDDWSNVNGPHMSAYAKSKTLAERAARDFIAAEGGDMHFSSVNPGFVLGPVLDDDFGTSAGVIQMILRGKYPGMPRLQFGCVDVRDIAEMHLRAVETTAPGGGRYLGVADTLWFVEIARAIKEALGADAKKVPNRQLPDFLVKTIALIDPGVRGIVSDLGQVREFDNARTRQALGMDFIPARQAAIATARSLVDLKLV